MTSSLTPSPIHPPTHPPPQWPNHTLFIHSLSQPHCLPSIPPQQPRPQHPTHSTPPPPPHHTLTPTPKHILTPPPPTHSTPTHTLTHPTPTTQSIDLITPPHRRPHSVNKTPNQHPAPHSPPLPHIHWPNHLWPFRQQIVMQLIAHTVPTTATTAATTTTTHTHQSCDSVSKTPSQHPLTPTHLPTQPPATIHHRTTQVHPPTTPSPPTPPPRSQPHIHTLTHHPPIPHHSNSVNQVSQQDTQPAPPHSHPSTNTTTRHHSSSYNSRPSIPLPPLTPHTTTKTTHTHTHWLTTHPFPNTPTPSQSTRHPISTPLQYTLTHTLPLIQRSNHTSQGLTYQGIFTCQIFKILPFSIQTRTRTPSFWGYPPPASWLPIPLSHIGSQVKKRQSKLQILKIRQNFKFFEFWNGHYRRHTFWSSLMCKYEMDPMSTLEDTERTRFCPQTDRRTRWYQYTPFQLCWSGGIIIWTDGLVQDYSNSIANALEWVNECFKFNTLRPERNEQHFADNIFKRIFININFWISIKCSLKFVLNNTPAMVQIMAWRRSGHKPLSESMMVSLPTHICVTRPQWVNSLSQDSRQLGPCSPHKPCYHSLYIEIIIFPHLDNTQSTGHK